MLLLPSHTFAENFIQSNLTATPSTSMGTLLTASGSINTKGSWSSLIDPVNFDVYRIDIQLFDCFLTGTNEKTLLDIGIGPSGGGSETVVLPNLLMGGCANSTFTAGAPMRHINLPFYIPAGVRISARIQSSTASNTGRIVISLQGGPTSPPWHVFTSCDDIGTNTGTSAGTAHTAGNSGAESSWASVGSTLARDYDAFFWLMQINSTAVTALEYHFEIGYSSTTLAEGRAQGATNETLGGPYPNGPIYVPLPSGTQMQTRGECSGTAVSQDVAIYGLY